MAGDTDSLVAPDAASGDPAEPLPAFADLGFSEPVLRALAEAGYQRPLPVQAACAAPVMAGRDVIVQSRTGSGKTIAFAVPLLHRLAFDRAVPQVLVLAPTRELALQDHGEFEKAGRHLPVRTVAIYGGTGFGLQLDRLREGVHVVVGTPGRVLDHWRRRTLDLSQVRTLVLDEADEMLSAGFYEDILKVFGTLKSLDQVLLFSATIPPNIERLVARYMKDPTRVDLSGGQVNVDRIENIAYMIDPIQPRLRSLLSVLEAEDPGCAIIFCNTKANTEVVSAYLRRRGYQAAMLNSDLSQAAREAVMGRMKAGQQRLLVATDIAARGIDISFLPCVINYEPPDDPELYIHRTGRTGRVDRSGRAVTLVSARDVHVVRRMESRYGVTLTKVVPPSREETLTMLADRRIREIKERIEAGAVIPEEFRAIAQEILTDPDAANVIAMLLDRYLAEPVPTEEQARQKSLPPPTEESGRRPRGGNRYRDPADRSRRRGGRPRR
ncbi:MAG: DEAD/DEAH box helicase [Deltaproteobacteria bacterium]|nr:DEAD/DEAH box helicase [Deltaproteobacteria bacterium]